MRKSFTVDQRRIIDGIGQNMLVSASAGSGKTTTMIERTARAVEEGASLEETVICTFTRAAAADMKEKLYAALHERNKDTASDVFEGQLALLATAEISTLDSLCQRILRNYFYALDLDPGFEVADENDAKTMLAESIAEAISSMLDTGNADFLFLYDALLSNRKDRRMQALIEHLYTYAYTQPDPEAWLKTGALTGAIDPRGATEFLRKEEQRLTKQLLGQLKAHRLACEMAGYHRDRNGIDAIMDGLSDPNAIIDEIPGPSERNIGDIDLDATYKQLKDKPLERIMTLRDMLRSPDTGQGTERYAAALLQATSLAAEGYSSRKKRRGVLDYNDLEHGALQVLKSPDAAAEIAEKYKYVFVDEYQDINPLQDKIISMLSVRSTVMLVGDIKQSIYAFRCCDPGIFLEKLRQPEAYGFTPPVLLNHNFRSRLEILEFCNDVFSHAMTEDFGGIDYAREARLIGREGYTGGRVTTTVLQKSKQTAEPDGRVYSVLAHEDEGDERAEMRLVDCMIHDIVQLLSGGEIEENGTTRPVSPGDIAVLTRSQDSAAAALYHGLRAVGIETHFKSETLFASAPETAVLIAFIRYLNNRTDDVALASLLRSPFAALTEDEMAAIKLSVTPINHTDDPYPSGHYSAAAMRYAAEEKDGTAEKLRGFFARIDEYERYSAAMSVGELLGRLVSKTGYFMHVFAMPSGALRAQTLSRFLTQLGTAHKGKTVAEYASMLNTVEPGTTPDALPGTLRIMTMHAAKGLEFPFVFILNAAKQFNMQDTRTAAILDAEWGLCLKTWDAAERQVRKNHLYTAASIRLSKRQREEELRLLYVALTRPKERLYLYAALDEKHPLFTGGEAKPASDALCFFDWLLPAVQKWGYTAPSELPESGTESIGAANPALDAAQTAVWTAAIEKRLQFVYPYAGRDLKTTVTQLLQDDGDETPTYAHTGESDDRAGERGTAYHHVMERLSLTGDFDAAWEALGLPERTLELVDKQKVRAARDTVNRYIGGRTYYREQPFLLADEGRLIQGVIDLIVIDGERAAIVDYKTSPVSKLKAGVYDLQLRLYARAAEQILKVRVQKLHIYAFDTDELIEVATYGDSLNTEQ